MATLKELPSPKDLEALSVADIISSWRKHMKRAGGSIGIQKAAELISEAKRSMGDTSALHEAKQDLKRLIEEYERVVKTLEEMEKDITAQLDEIPLAAQLRSIKGLGPIFIAAILSGAGDLSQYAHGRQLLRKAGLNLAESMSGKRKGQIILSKRGDATLRKYLYLATIVLIATNPVFRQMHEHNIRVKHMKKLQSVFKLLGKLARIMIGIVHTEEMFSLEKAAPNLTQAAS